jgi:hypothetical protein
MSIFTSIQIILSSAISKLESVISNPSVVAAAISAFLIILNDWTKRSLDNRYKKKKFKLWEKSYQQRGMKVSEKDLPLLYELLEDQVVEIEITFGANGNIIYAYPKGMKPQV